MIRGLAGALALVLVLAPGVHAQGTDDTAALRLRLNELDAELASLRARLGGVSAPSAGVASDRRLDQLEGEVRRLTARIEQMQNRLERVVADATRRIGDIEFRLDELEGNPPAGASQPLGAAPQSAPSVSVSERGDLNRAAEDVRQGRYDQAEERLTAFMRAYPGSPLMAEAHSWRARAAEDQGKLKDAGTYHLEAYNAAPNGPLAAPSLIGLGRTLGRLGQVREACLTLAEVPRRFSQDADSMREAAGLRADLGCG